MIIFVLILINIFLKTVYAIGLMSGTSLDGVDLVYVKFTCLDTYSMEVLCYETIPYSHLWKKKLHDAFYFNDKKLKELNILYGSYLSELLNRFIGDNGIEKLDFIASHGHTIHHKPEKKYTLQIGDGQTIANKTNQKVICNFRVQDVLLDGQGAPLVPIGDAFLFSKYDYCLNLGGFANISFTKNKNRLAYDICPVNIVLNHYVSKLGLAYDDKGVLARSGKVHNSLLTELNNLDFYISDNPKSLGYEFVTNVVFPIINSYNLKIADVLHTFVEHISIQIANKINPNTTVLVSGGGVFNSYLMERITDNCKATICIPNPTIIDYKEAIIFAFLGLRKLENKINCLKSVTGASKDHCSGFVYRPT